MKRVYTWKAQPARRTVTIADMRAAKGTRQWTQVTANTAEEAEAAAKAGLDMIICNCVNTAAVRQGNNTLFLTASMPFPDYATTDDIMRMAVKCLGDGADAVMTARSMKVVATLAREDIPVMGHLGLVPRKSTWFGGLRAVGKTATEAHELYHKFRRLEEAGAVMVEAEVIPAAVMAEISKYSGLLTVSLGSGRGCDINYQFMEDICGDSQSSPRHARSYADLHGLRERIKSERVRALTEFQADAQAGKFPGPKEEAGVNESELEKFRAMLAKGRL